MAGLPCDVCQEPSPVVRSCEPALDGNGVLVYVRWRVCINPRCERYMQRRVTLESHLLTDEEPYTYRPAEVRRILRALGTPPDDSDPLPLLPWAEDEPDTS